MIIKKYKKFFESLKSIWDLDEEDIREIFFSLEDENMDVDINRTFLEYKDSKIKYYDYEDLILDISDIKQLKIYPDNDVDGNVILWVIGYSISLIYENDTDLTKEFFAAIKRLENLSKEYELKIFNREFGSGDEEITDYLLYVKEGGFYYDHELSTEDILITLIKKTPYTKKEIINSL